MIFTSLILRGLLGTSGIICGISGLFLGGIMITDKEKVLSIRNLLSIGTMITSSISVIGSLSCYYSGSYMILYFGLGTQLMMIIISYFYTYSLHTK